MVVVAEGIFDDKPLSLAGSNPYLRECLLQNKTRRVYRQNNVVVVSGLANICARVYEQIDDDAAPKAVLFSQQTSASQLYHAVCHLFEEYPSPDLFDLVLIYNDKKYRLKFENKQLPELNLQSLQGMQYADIGVSLAIKNGDHQEVSLEQNHKSTEKPSNNYKIIDVSPRDEASPLCWSFLISPSTTLRELDDNMLFLSARSPSQTSVHLHYQKTGQDTTIHTRYLQSLENLDVTFEQIDIDFSLPNQTITIVLPTDIVTESESKPRVNLDDNKFLQEIFPTTSDFGMSISEYKSASKYKPEIEAKPEMTYVGLVNQAMTCYLNSLLQALYMTPEFRNALYNWEYVDGPDKEKAIHSIPYQLQKLFLNLQTSTKAAVETTSLTKSFGWDSTEAWQQHDIQELCRVMFDALEQKFKNTQQADLINRLYEGKMIDYVKCLECSTEKTREDTFLDIPLPVKPFGSNVAYNSVEEALRAFVQPETLDGVNQYFCENCNKKCDAHKGLKFTKFPYLLTLHLKRFDFDYNTFHRIKLNDKVTFPDVLNLNSFIPSDDQESPTAEEDVGVKCDDSSTTDSGNLDECPIANGIHSEPSTELNNHEQDDDEGIDMSNGPSTSSTEQETDNRRPGPYQYELFSIMIHSGSASGGHYYAYIKDFRTNEWLCFNDQNVTPITDDDIQKTYGGGPTRGYYSGAYSSSTNAYMLMYRQIDAERNCPAMEVNDFPKHIQELLVKMKEEEEERRNYDRPQHMYKIKVHLHHPTENVVKSRKTFSLHDETLSEMLEKTHKAFDLDGIVDLDQCRLVTYHAESDTIDSTFDGYENDTLDALFQQSNPDMLLEIRKKDEQFERYLPGGIGSKVFILDCVKKEVIDGPIYVRAVRTQLIKDYKEQLAEVTGINPEHMLVALQKPMSGITGIKILGDNEMLNDVFTSGNRVFVTSTEHAGEDRANIEHTLSEMVSNFDSIISLFVELPDVSEEILEELNIQSLESKQREKEQKEQQKEEESQKKAEGGESSQKDENWFPICRAKEKDEWYEQSNSEDSSLSDSDRTLVGDASEDDELAPATTFDDWLGQSSQDRQDSWENDQDDSEPEYFFKAIPYTKDDKRHLRVLVDRKMRFAPFRKHLEPFVGVPVESFKVIRHAADSCDVDYDTRLATLLRIWDDGEKVSIKLGRALRSNEFRVKVYYLDINNINDVTWTPLFEWTVSKDSTVGTVKKQLLAELKRKNIPSLPEIPFERCRLRKKNFQIPSKVLLNDQKIRDCGFQSQCELIIQKLDKEDPVTSPNQIVVMVNRIRYSSDKVFGPVHEIVLEDKCYQEWAQKLSDLSGIEMEYLQVAKGKWFGDSYSSRKPWNKASEVPWHSMNIEDGASIFYRDSREKWLGNDAEERPLVRRDNRDNRRMQKVTYGSDSPRRERALKIYLDDK